MNYSSGTQFASCSWQQPLTTRINQMSYQPHNSTSELTTTAIAERRQMHDRRVHSWRTLTYCGLKGRGRRRHARRDDYNYYLDWYDTSESEKLLRFQKYTYTDYLDDLANQLSKQYGRFFVPFMKRFVGPVFGKVIARSM